MEEITENFVAQFLAQINCFPPPEFYSVLRKTDEDIKKILPIVADLLINKMKYSNPINFLEDILRLEDLSRSHLSHIKREVQEAKKVIDVGCGWGVFTKMLCEEYEEVSAVDWVLEHAVASKALSPKARVYHGDARDMHIIESGYFDVVFAKDLIEHVGDPVEPPGKSIRNFYHQYNLVKELSRICKPDGQVFISTGNYIFPRDGETHVWFYHWLPAKEKMDYCAHKNRSTDNYWLLNWSEIDFLLSLCGLTVESVIAIDTDRWEEMLFNHLDRSFQGLDPYMIELWKNLINKEAQFYSEWHIMARKTGTEPDIKKKNNRCYYHRAMYFDDSSGSYCQIVAAKDQEEARLQKIMEQISVFDVICRKVRKLIRRLKNSNDVRKISSRLHLDVIYRRFKNSNYVKKFSPRLN